MGVFDYMKKEKTISINDYVEFTDDRHTDKGPCIAKVIDSTDIWFVLMHDDEHIKYYYDNIDFKETYQHYSDKNVTVYVC